MGMLKELNTQIASWMSEEVYSKIYLYICDDSITNIYICKEKNDQKHMYRVRDFEKIKTTKIVEAIYALLHEEGKNRRVIYIRHESGIYEISSSDTKVTILKKIMEIDFYNLNKDLF